MLKVMTVVGTRPELIRLSVTIRALDELTQQILVHTGQNDAPELKDVFFKDLEIRNPDYYLEAQKHSFGQTLSRLFDRGEKVITSEKPDALLVLGDTNSSLITLIAKRHQIPIFHVEAGNRSFDANVPEEANRKLVDHISDYNLVYSQHAKTNLLNEGVRPDRIFVVGTPLVEVIQKSKENIECSTILTTLNLEPESYVLASIHRQENVDNIKRLKRILTSLGSVSKKLSKKVIFSTHPRTQNKITANDIPLSNTIHLMKPFNFSDYCALQKKAYCVISDSGSVTEEAALLNFPAVTPRNLIERPEGMETAAITLCSIDRQSILNAVITARHLHDVKQKCRQRSFIPSDYMIENTSQRILNCVLSNAPISNEILGIRPLESDQSGR